MKLELKHLAAYLPYKVKVSKLHFLNEGNGIGGINHLLTTKSNYKLHLRTLSNLVIDEDLIEDFIGLGNWCNAYDEYIDHWYPDASYAQQAPYVIFEYFLSNHYDVFNLIPYRLAIDINALNNKE